MVPFAGWEMPVQYEGVIQEHRAVRGVHELRGDHIAAAHRVDLTVHHRLGVLALGQLARDGQIERRAGRAAHAAERLGDGGGIEQAHHARLREIHAQRLRE